MTEAIHPVLSAAGRFRQQLLQREDQAVNRLVQAYATAYRNIGTQIEAMQEIAALGPMTRDDAVKLAQLRALRRSVNEELNRFGVIADNEMTQLSREGITLGLNHSTGLVEAYFGSPQALQALRASFTQLVPEQVETLLGFLAPDSLLREGLTNRLGAEVADRVSDAMVDGMVRGMNPRTTAALIRREFGVGLPWAVNTVRTANLWAYREATRANYIANRNVVSGWTWYATLDRRVCHSCISKHGTRYPVESVLSGHHQCRCVPIPEVPLARQLGIDLPDIEPGEQWFARQDADTQTAIMGPGMLAAWKDGAVRFDQLSVTYDDPVYGPMQRAATLKDLGLEEYYQR